jgi:hypothetical protein
MIKKKKKQNQRFFFYYFYYYYLFLSLGKHKGRDQLIQDPDARTKWKIVFMYCMFQTYKHGD